MVRRETPPLPFNPPVEEMCARCGRVCGRRAGAVHGGCLRRKRHRTHLMKTLPTLLRHALTFLAGLGGLLLSYQLILQSEVTAANEAGTALIEPLTVLGGLLFAGLARVGITLLGKFFPVMNRESGGTSGGMSLLVLGGLCMAAAGGLSSCSSAKMPLRLSVTGPHGSASYSPKGGLIIDLPLPAEGSNFGFPRRGAKDAEGRGEDTAD